MFKMIMYTVYGRLTWLKKSQSFPFFLFFLSFFGRIIIDLVFIYFDRRYVCQP